MGATDDPDDGSAGALPARLGSFVLLRRLGRGGMGDVYLAKQELELFHRPCVVKLLRQAHSKSSLHVQRFLDEARTTLLLSHKNVCSVLDVGTARGKVYLAMEHIAGRDLRAVLRRCAERNQHLPLAVSVHIFGEILDALDYAHALRDTQTGESLSLVHRDVSPHNVMVSFAGVVKLIDFGVAQSAAQLTKTDPGLVVGKLHYMSPEQATGAVLTGKSDVFSTAILAYEMLALDRFYPSKNTEDIGRMLDDGSYVPPHFATLPEGLQQLLRRALALRPADRPTASELRRELLNWAVDHKCVCDTSAVRAFIAEIFPGEQDAERSLLSTVDPQSTEDETGVTTTSRKAGAQEAETRSHRVRNGSGSGASRSVPRQEQLSAASSAPPADSVAAQAAPRTSRRVAAALVLGCASLLLVAWVLRQPSEVAQPRDAVSAQPPERDVVPVVVAPSEPVAPIDVDVSPDGALAPVDVDVTTVVVPSSDAARVKRKVSKPRTVPAPTPVVAAPAPVVAPPVKPLPPRPRLLADRVRYAQQHCAALPCTTRAAQSLRQMASMSADELEKLKADVSQCLDACRAP